MCMCACTLSRIQRWAELQNLGQNLKVVLQIEREMRFANYRPLKIFAGNL